MEKFNIGKLHSENSSSFDIGKECYDACKTPHGDSVLDNTETLRQSNQKYSNFVLCSHRHHNLTLANRLKNSIHDDDMTVHKTAKSLMCCSSRALIHNEKEIVATSKKCRNKMCAICNRAKSAKMVSRLSMAMDDDVNKKHFNGKNWYFLTFTLRHKKGVREEVYLNELKGHLKNFFRSKIWKTYFGKTGKEWDCGWLVSIENSIKDNGHHIHAHVLVCGKKLPKKVNDIQNEFKSKWLSLTTDSNGVRLDLIKNIKPNNSKGSSGLKSAVMELFKYSTKVGNLKRMSDKVVGLYAEWIIESKGKNLLNAHGFFRGMQITGLKSKYDSVGEFENEYPDDGTLHLGKTSDVYFNHNHRKSYTKKGREAIRKNVEITMIDDFVDVTDIRWALPRIMSHRFGEYDEDGASLSNFVEVAFAELEEGVAAMNLLDELDVGDAVCRMGRQMDFGFSDRAYTAFSESW